MMKPFLFLLMVSGWAALLPAQNDPVLFTVEETPVYLSEFEYIYSKTNGEKADFSRTSLEEYLNLYKNFKLKVKRAREMKLDTIPSLQRELAGYRQQLANSYLVDKEVTDRLIREAYERSKFDVDISHIMIGLRPTASDKDVKIAEQKLINVQRKLKEGVSFEELAKQHSEDKNTKANGGRMGYFTALFPDGFYNLESAAYNTKVGEVSDIVKTSVGLHLVKVNERREARGQVEVAHLLIRDVKAKDGNASKVTIDKIYERLKAGEDFDVLAKELSEDKKTKDKNGYLGFIGIRQVGQSFEDAAFALTEDGAFSMPVKSQVGWHIIKRISKKPVEAYDIAKRRIQTKMQESQRRSKTPKYNRLNNAKKAMIARIKQEANFRENQSILNSFIGSLDSTFASYKWKAPAEKPADVLFTLGDSYKGSLADFQYYCQRNSKRMRLGNRMDRGELVKQMYNDFLEEQCMKYEETQLDEKYPEFKSLMREYEEGILLFEATKILVWDKASQDSVGLQNFYQKRKGVYQWNERAVTTQYIIKAGHEDDRKKIQKYAKKHTPQEVLAKFNTAAEKIVSFEERTFEKDKSKLPAGLTFKVGDFSDTETNKRNKAVSFHKVEKILPKSEKTLQDARGYVIADYQDYLEKKWLEELAKEYEIKVNQDVFEGLIK